MAHLLLVLTPEAVMHVIDLDREHEDAWLHCLEPEVEEIRDGVPRKRAWANDARSEGLIVKLAIDDDGEVAGMIQSVPIERSWALGRDLQFIQCIWVHRHKEGIGDRSGRGIGRALMVAIEAEARQQGALGLAAWGLAVPIWMRASWFKSHGFRHADRSGVTRLLWKPFSDAAHLPRWPDKPVRPLLAEGRVTVTCFDAGWCTLQNANCERAHRAATAAGANVVYHEVDTADPRVAHQWRQGYGIWVDHRQVGKGPPLREKVVRAAIDKRLRRRSWRRRAGR